MSSSLPGVIWGANTIIIPLYFKSLGLSTLLIGEILGSAIVLNTLLSLFFATLGDAFGRKRYIIISRSVSILSYFLILFTPFAYLFANQGYGLISSLIAEKTQDLDKIFAYRTSLNIIFSIMGSLLPLFLSYIEIIVMDAGILIVSLLLILPVKEKYKGTKKLSLHLSSFRIIGKLSTEAIIGLGAGFLLPMLSLWFNLKFGVTASSLSPIYAISEATLALGTLFSPYLGRRLGRIRTIFFTHLLAIIILFFMPFSPSLFIAGVLYVSRNTLMNISGPLMNSFVMKIVKEEERGRANSMLQLLDAIPRSIGPTITGYLFSFNNLSFPFFITATLYLTATILFYFFFKDVNV
ncbi:MFS transporter [Sulfolobus tengchongensis]|uniref:MFS transporter n=1 Tax=Sulfolobus tengchongensis TaxID=207809 RepID=A0AAX4L421_9CREN